MIRGHNVCIATMGIFLLSGKAQAAACPVDLSALGPQIRTSALRDHLTTPLLTIVEHEGGLESALAHANARLAKLRDQRRAVSDPASGPAIAMDDAISILSAEVAALTCMQGQ